MGSGSEERSWEDRSPRSYEMGKLKSCHSENSLDTDRPFPMQGFVLCHSIAGGNRLWPGLTLERLNDR